MPRRTAQPTLFDPEDDSLDHARELGRAQAAKCEANAVSQGWDSAGATEFILAFLREHGPTSGEVLVSEATKRYRPHDGRAFGPVFMRLKKAGRIVRCGTAPRTKGHGTAGAIIWKLMEQDA